MMTPMILPLSGSIAAMDSSSMRHDLTQAQVQNCLFWLSPREAESGASGKKWVSRKSWISSNIEVVMGRMTASSLTVIFIVSGTESCCKWQQTNTRVPQFSEKANEKALVCSGGIDRIKGPWYNELSH